MITLKPIILKGHPKYNEKWIQGVIASDPKIIGLGEVEVKDIERKQPHAGRLDILLQNDENKRYEVEIQLGATDESHLIRTIEYWDIESKRYPQYKHCAVIIAEDVTTRFLNVIQLFNGFIPLIALKLTAYEVNGDISLTFTKILGERTLGLTEDDEKTSVSVDRGSWKGYEKAIEIAELIVELSHEVGPKTILTFKKHYLGISADGVATNFMWFKPRKDYCVVCFSIEKNAETDALVESMGLDTLEYEDRYSAYRIKMSLADIGRCKNELLTLIKKSFDFYGS